MGHRREGCPYTIQAQVQGKSVIANTRPMEGEIPREVNVIPQEAGSPNLGAKDEFRSWMLVNRRKDRPNSNGPHSPSSPLFNSSTSITGFSVYSSLWLRFK